MAERELVDETHLKPKPLDRQTTVRWSSDGPVGTLHRELSEKHLPADVNLQEILMRVGAIAAMYDQEVEMLLWELIVKAEERT